MFVDLDLTGSAMGFSEDMPLAKLMAGWRVIAERDGRGRLRVLHNPPREMETAAKFFI